MYKFSYQRATSPKQAVDAVVEKPETSFIAGGTNLLDLMKEHVAKPAHLVDISRLKLSQIENLPDGSLRLGALATNAQTAWNDQLTQDYPLLSKAILSGASAQLRNKATNGGNLLQRTRCYYFYDVSAPCNKRTPGSGCSAIGGFNRIHAILGTSEQCIATHPSDMCVALAALDARVHVSSSKGDRIIDMADFHRTPGETPQLDNNLQPGELVTSIDLPPNKFQKAAHYLKIRDRRSYAFALVSVAAAVELDGNTIKEVRVALGGVAHKPWRDKAAEITIVGQPATAESFTRLAVDLLKDAIGQRDNRFKIELARRAIVMALQAAAGIQNRK